MTIDQPPFKTPRPLEYAEHFRPGMGTEYVGPFLRALAQMLRPRRILEIGAGYTTPFLLEALVNNERVLDDGNLCEKYFSDYIYDSKLIVIDDMSLGDLQKQPGMEHIINSPYVDYVEGLFQGKAQSLFQKYGAFDFVWFDCGGPPEYEAFLSEYLNICNSYVFFHFTYSEGRPNRNLEIIQSHTSNQWCMVDIIEPHKKSQGSVTLAKRIC